MSESAEEDRDEGAAAGDAALEPPAEPFLKRRSRVRPRPESLFVRVVATAGIVGISVAVAAVLGTQSIAAWVIGLVASALSVVLAAVLWSSRTL
jgi:hypothetical protein